jgi:hypothetical protein
VTIKVKITYTGKDAKKLINSGINVWLPNEPVVTNNTSVILDKEGDSVPDSEEDKKVGFVPNEPEHD